MELQPEARSKGDTKKQERGNERDEYMRRVSIVASMLVMNGKDEEEKKTSASSSSEASVASASSSASTATLPFE